MLFVKANRQYSMLSKKIHIVRENFAGHLADRMSITISLYQPIQDGYFVPPSAWAKLSVASLFTARASARISQSGRCFHWSVDAASC